MVWVSECVVKCARHGRRICSARARVCFVNARGGELIKIAHTYRGRKTLSAWSHDPPAAGHRLLPDASAARYASIDVQSSRIPPAYNIMQRGKCNNRNNAWISMMYINVWWLIGWFYFHLVKAREEGSIVCRGFSQFIWFNEYWFGVIDF